MVARRQYIILNHYISTKTCHFHLIAIMPINYSKWDALELSDDSDVEVHPNVDKQIREEEQNRYLQVRTNRQRWTSQENKCPACCSTILQSSTDKRPDDLAFQALMESTGEDDSPPHHRKGYILM
ncbi:hypothetical protein EYC84_012047 [Monilinia fructicola]|uniref:Cdc37 N-terminal domain-containing protein n=1 Tax=Monilinia fructicola TaxID=38448 RepID=A0A5M9J4D8_MONFR|nr:hypothetical protein EYC84_012047 [Monilinia fructicola]